jgi:hypothetical protein
VKKNSKKALQIAEVAYKLASGEVLGRLKEDIRIIKEVIEAAECEAAFEPIRLRIEALKETSEAGRLMSEGRSILNALNAKVDGGMSKEWAESLYLNLGWLIRGKAIKANNELNDANSAKLLVYLAQEIVKEGESRQMDLNELRLKLQQDAITLAQNAVQPRATARSSYVPYRPTSAPPPYSGNYTRPTYQAQPSATSGGSCLLPLVAILCLTGAAGYAAPMALQTAHTFLKTLLP